MVAIPFEDLKSPARKRRELDIEYRKGLTKADEPPIFRGRSGLAKLDSVAMLAIVNPEILRPLRLEPILRGMNAAWKTRTVGVCTDGHVAISKNKPERRLVSVLRRCVGRCIKRSHFKALQNT
jgi:hypothetical protein